MKLYIFIGGLIFSILLTGCSSKVYLSKPNITDEQYNNDKAYCEYEAIKHAPMPVSPDTYGLFQKLAREDIFKKCMEVEKGYTQFKSKKEAQEFKNSIEN